MRGIASRYVKILTPIMLAAALILISGIFWYDWQNQLLINAETSKKNVETAKIPCKHGSGIKSALSVRCRRTPG